MEPTEHPVAVTETHTDVPEGVRRARATFLRDFSALITDHKTRGKYVCYHNDARVIVANNYVAMIREVVAKGIPQDASLIFKVTPAAELEQQAIAEEGELP
jgi:hypothetical protein